jgi:hypothetical protein
LPSQPAKPHASTWIVDLAVNFVRRSARQFILPYLQANAVAGNFIGRRGFGI